MKSKVQWGMFGWIVAGALVLLAILSAPTHAGDRADLVKSYEPEGYCRYISALFGTGVVYRNERAPLVFLHIDKLGDAVNKKGIPLRGLNEYTAHERAFVIEHISNGYTYASVLITKSKGDKLVVDPDAAAKGYFDTCLEVKAEELYQQRQDEREHNIKQTGPRLQKMNHDIILSTDEVTVTVELPADEAEAAPEEEIVVHPDGQSELMCAFKVRSAQWIMVVKVGLTEEEFWRRHPFPEEWREEVKQAARWVVQAAFLWPGTTEEFVEYTRSRCLTQ